MAYAYTSYGETYELDLKRTVYENNTLAIITDIASGPEKGMPFGNITVNLDYPQLKPNQAFADVNNMKNIDAWLVRNNLAKHTGTIRKSGYVSYPLMEFDLDKIPEIP